jgi:hypothetical protein
LWPSFLVLYAPLSSRFTFIHHLSLCSSSIHSRTQALDAELLQRRETELLEKEGSGCRVLLMNDRVEDLSRMFRLFSRITDGLVPVAEIFKTHITDLGTFPCIHQFVVFAAVTHLRTNAGDREIT